MHHCLLLLLLLLFARRPGRLCLRLLHAIRYVCIEGYGVVLPQYAKPYHYKACTSRPTACCPASSVFTFTNL